MIKSRFELSRLFETELQMLENHIPAADRLSYMEWVAYNFANNILKEKTPRELIEELSLYAEKTEKLIKSPAIDTDIEQEKELANWCKIVIDNCYKPYTSISQIKEANREAGYTWFGATEMRYFKTRVGDVVYKGKYFITSEKERESNPRKYTIREATHEGDIKNASKIMEYNTWGEARRAVDKLD